MEILFQFKGFAFFVELLVKSSLLLAAALFCSFWLRRQSASLRHLVLWVSLLSLVTLPFLAGFAPGWQANIIPAFQEDASKNLTNQDPGAVKDAHLFLSSTKVLQNTDTLSLEKGQGPRFLFSWRHIYPYGLLVLWGAGLTFFLTRLVLGLYGTCKLTRQGVIISGYPWKQLLLLFLREIPLKKKISLLKNDRVIVPMTWGFKKPVILMPFESEHWPVRQCSSALFHELSHIKRRDFLVRLVSRAACALFWFNPLGWVVLRKLRKEQEKACDELVLKSGIKPSTYASCLLRMKQFMTKGQYYPTAAVSMAGQSEFKERLSSILKKQLNRKEEKMRTKLTLLILAIFAIVLIGTARPYQAQPPMDKDAAIAQTPVDEGKAAAKTEDKKEEKKKQQEGEKKCQQEEKEVNIVISEEAEEKGESQVKKAIKMKLEGGHLIICEGDKVLFEDICITGGDKKLKWINEEGKVIDIKGCKIKVIKEKDGSKNIVIVKEGEGDKAGAKKVYKIKTEVIGAKDKKDHRHVVVSEAGEKHKKLTENMAALKKALEGIDKEFKKKSPAQKKAIAEMEEALKKMEKDLESKEKEFKEIDIHLEGMPHDQLIELDEDDARLIKIKEAKGKDFVVLTRDALKGKKGMHMKYIIKGRTEEKYLEPIKKAVQALQEVLPKAYQVTPEFGDDSVKINIDYPTEELDEKICKEAQKEIEKFEAELKKILPGQEGEKGIIKMITIKEKEEK